MGWIQILVTCLRKTLTDLEIKPPRGQAGRYPVTLDMQGSILPLIKEKWSHISKKNHQTSFKVNPLNTVGLKECGWNQHLDYCLGYLKSPWFLPLGACASRKYILLWLKDSTSENVIRPPAPFNSSAVLFWEILFSVGIREWPIETTLAARVFPFGFVRVPKDLKSWNFPNLLSSSALQGLSGSPVVPCLVWGSDISRVTFDPRCLENRRESHVF